MFDGSVSEQPNGRFKLHREGDYWMLNHQKLEDNETWELMYRFKDDWPLRLSDFQDIHETYTYGKDPLSLGLILKPMAQVNNFKHSFDIHLKLELTPHVFRLREMTGRTAKRTS